MKISITANALFKTNTNGLAKFRDLLNPKKEENDEYLNQILPDLIPDFKLEKVSPVKEVNMLISSNINIDTNKLFTIKNDFTVSKITVPIKITKTDYNDVISKDLSKEQPFKIIKRNELSQLMLGIESKLLVGKDYNIIGKANFIQKKIDLGLTEQFDVADLKLKIQESDEEILAEAIKPRRNFNKKKNNGFIDAIIFAGIIGFSVGLIFMSILALLKL